MKYIALGVALLAAVANGSCDLETVMLNERSGQCPRDAPLTRQCQTMPQIDLNCCLVNCRPAVCGLQALTALQTCPAGVLPRMNWVTGCPSCKIVKCAKKVDDIPLCAAGVRPQRVDNCPSCRLPTCSETDFAAAPTCAEDQVPEKDELTQCPTCKRAVCTKEQFAQIPACTADAKPARDTTTGCPTCKVGVCDAATLAALPECTAAPVKNPTTGCPSCKTKPCAKTPDEIPECASGAQPTVDFATGCRSCRTPVCRVSKLAPCADGAEQSFTNGCPTCRKVPVRCTLEPKLIPACNEGEKPSRDEATGCPSCNIKPPVRCTTTPADIPVCAEGVEPTKGADGCASCRRTGGTGVGGDGKCTKEAVKKCAESIKLNLIPECEGEKPTRDPTTCCLTCVPKKAQCSAENVKLCKESYAQLPTCASLDDSANAFNKDLCCATCKRPVPRAEEKPDAAGKCSKEAVQECLKNVPVCSDDEEVVRDKAYCCPSCKRPQRLCTKEQVASCRVATPECAADETPSFVEGDCCPSCRKARPTCTPSCGDGSRCVRSREDGTATCTAEQKMTVKLKITEAGMRPGSVDTTEKATEVLTEIVERYCDNEAHQEECAEGEQPVLDSIETTSVRPGTVDDLVMEVVVSERPGSSAGRRLLAEITTSALVGNSVSDPEAASGMLGTAAAATTSKTCVVSSTKTDLLSKGGVEVVSNGKTTYIVAGANAEACTVNSLSVAAAGTMVADGVQKTIGAYTVSSSGMSVTLTTAQSQFTDSAGVKTLMRAIPKNSCLAYGCTPKATWKDFCLDKTSKAEIVCAGALPANTIYGQSMTPVQPVGPQCYCDDACTRYRDCCADFQATCGVFVYGA